MKNNSRSFASLRYREFRSYFGLRFFFTFAYMMQTTILGFYVYQLTHNKLHLALLGVSELVPVLLLGLYGGYITDRSEKRSLLLVVYGSYLLTTLFLFIVTHHRLGLSTSTILACIYTMLSVNGIARAFYEPAAQAVFAGSVPRKQYANASTWNNISWMAAFIIGPGAGGFIYAVAKEYGISATLAVVMLLLLVALFFVMRLNKYPARLTKGESIRKSITAGIRFVFEQPVMKYAMCLDLFCVLFGGVTALLPVYAIDILKTGAEGLGMMRMAQSIGAALTMLVLVRFPATNKPWRNLLIAVTGFGICVIAFGISRVFVYSLLFLFLQGAFDSVSVMIRGTLMQLLTPDDMQGRVAALHGMFIGSSIELGNFESGIAAKLLGTIPAVVVGGSLTVLIVVFTFFKTKKLLPLSITDVRTGHPLPELPEVIEQL